ncbi:MAG: glycosyltransferase [Bacteroidales bacterium]
MIIILVISIVFALLYLAYPLWLMTRSGEAAVEETNSLEIGTVTLIYLSYNGAEFLQAKLDFLMKELGDFADYELIIIDDYSTDESGEILGRLQNQEKIKTILKSGHRGIPNSMNLGVKEARFDHVIFCDQRQYLARGVLRTLVGSLGDPRVGAVSACLSSRDKQNGRSLIRRLENFIKCQEGRTGNLIGVYGPLYAIRKACYEEIPEHIILDDLYLTLRILRTKQVCLNRECLIIDDDPAILHDYRRVRRYLLGFVQILRERDLIRSLNRQQRTMLLWHKYFRILIPVVLFLGYVALGILATTQVAGLCAFLLATLMLVLSLLPLAPKPAGRLMALVRINLFYFIALIQLGIGELGIRRVM